MNIIDQLLKPGYQVTDTTRNANCFQTEGKASRYLCAIVRNINEDEVVILEVDFILCFALVYKTDTELAVAKVQFATVVSNVFKPQL